MNTKFVAAAAIFAALSATSTQAVTVNARGLGQVLLYPYYTVNKSQDTLLSVVNTSDVGKVARIRFLEGYNGRSVLDLELYLSAHDVWTAAVSAPDATGESGARLVTHDHSCTTPAIPASGQPFSTAQYTGAYIAPYDAPDSGPQTVARTREGHVEIIANGDIIPGSETEQRITHVYNVGTGDGVPPGCAELSELSVAEDIVTPTNGLGGSAVIVNVGEGTFFGYNATALGDFTDVALTAHNPNVLYDTLDFANSYDEMAAGAAAFVPTEEGATLRLEYARGIDAVSAVLMADALYNEFLTAPGIGANTDWVVTFPTKRFYVDRQVYAGAPRAPFLDSFHAPGESLVDLPALFYDQEEGVTSTYPPIDGCGFICPAGRGFSLPYEVNVISVLTDTPIGAASGVFGSRLSASLAPYPGQNGGVAGDAGWIRLDMTGGGGQILRDDNSDWVLHGLPVIGFMAYNIVNSNALPGRLANYGGVFPHRSTFRCSTAEDFGAVPLPCDDTGPPR